jgi:ankyrin repeat protein
MACSNRHQEPTEKFQTLHEAVDAGDVEAVKRFISKGAKVDELNEHGVPSLLYAAARGHLDVARILIDKGADVNFLIEEGGTPLMGAARCLKPRLIEFLLSKGAQPNKRGDGGLFPLACPFQPNVEAVDKQIECIRLLVSAGAGINDRTDSGATPLMNAAWYGNTLAAEELLRLGADPELRDNRGRTAAMMAFERGHDELAKLLKNASER